jgi:hypothetical protein
MKHVLRQTIYFLPYVLGFEIKKCSISIHELKVNKAITERTRQNVRHAYIS